MSRDPVCGMEVNEAEAVEHAVFQGARYSFCCAECKLRFDGEPGRFVKPAAQPARTPCCGFGMVRRTVQRGAA